MVRSVLPAMTHDAGTTAPRYLHATRPNGAHAWGGPFLSDEEALVSWALVFFPHVPADAVWDVTTTTYPPKESTT
jgi:hypothetical protein